ncbi:hypothetical protein UFOVP75_223 [uncultured Caudovirales phage]|uniref:Uncharacterized protein n=1 Tax=uncultured Caudovirales phage TaxID=2100421 RepID=A0A6J5KZJ6_9CAUD|nr:hypothetical protein UFOVP75_223 [uncultured Caudovirales phage]
MKHIHLNKTQIKALKANKQISLYIPFKTHQQPVFATAVPHEERWVFNANDGYYQREVTCEAQGNRWQGAEYYRSPYGNVGDHVFVKEIYSTRLDVDHKVNPEKARHYCLYAADFKDRYKDPGNPDDDNNYHSWSPWRSPATMPKALSRFILEVVAIDIVRPSKYECGWGLTLKVIE